MLKNNNNSNSVAGESKMVVTSEATNGGSIAKSEKVVRQSMFDVRPRSGFNIICLHFSLDITSQPDEPKVVEDQHKEKEEKENDEMVICPGSDEDEDDAAVSFVPRRQRPTTGKIHQFRDVVERGTIPDAKVIYELKKQRQKLARTIQEDFIPLNSDDEETLRQESRLNRADNDEDNEADDKSDEDEDEDEFQEDSSSRASD